MALAPNLPEIAQIDETLLDPERLRKKHLTPLDMLGSRLRGALTETINARAWVEQRWLRDLQQYLGEYDEKALQYFSDNPDRASVYINLTRTLTNLSKAQLEDLLFPAEDKNFGIAPTPSPDIARDLHNQDPAMSANGNLLTDPETGQPVTNAEMAHRAQDIAREAARQMEREIDDQLVECRYPAEARRALHHAAVFGTGIICGPETISVDRASYGHTPVTNPMGEEVGLDGMTLTIERKRTPRARHVAPWDFYPDMSAANIEDAEFIFERSFMTRRQLRSLRRRPGFLGDNVSSLLAEGEPRLTRSPEAQSNLDALRQLTNPEGANTTEESRYEIWTYHGPVEVEALRTAGVKLPEPDEEKGIPEEVEGVVVFCGEHILRVALTSLETSERPYSVFCWQEDEFCIFGYGAPHTCRNEQRVINTAWRMVLDNAAKSAGPQVVVKRSAVVPADGMGNYTLTPWKLWLADETISDVRQAFTVFSFPSVQEEITNIIEMGRAFLNDTLGLPPQVGEGQGQAPNTLGGMAMMMNSANTDRRRQVREWDDRVTKPLITRLYHWNMQHSPKEDIKGDFEVHARGTSALLMREQQAINLMALLDKYAAHPALANAIKADATLRKIVQALHINPQEVVKTDEELKAEAEAAAQQPEQPDPQLEIEKLRLEAVQFREETRKEVQETRSQMEMERAQMERQLKIELAEREMAAEERRLQIEVMRIASQQDVNYKQILADLKKARAKVDFDSKKFEQELALKKEQGPNANKGLGGERI